MNAKQNAILCDLDETLFFLDRDPFATHLCKGDRPNYALFSLLKTMLEAQENLVLLLCTSSLSVYRKEREKQLALQGLFLPGYRLFAREVEDERPCPEYKRSILEKKVLPYYHITMAFEDHPLVCELYRAYGIPVFQVLKPQALDLSPLKKEQESEQEETICSQP